MQAKKVFEVQNFERGKNPKSALDLGGIDLGKELQKRVSDLNKAKEKAELIANQEWNMFLQKSLVGKKITAVMTSLPAFKIKSDGGIGEKVGVRETKEFTITVQDIQTDDLSDMMAAIIVADMDNKMYQLYIKDKKIYFE